MTSTHSPAAIIEQTLAHMLDGLRFPAQRWRVITTADLYGADHQTRAALLRLPDGTYTDLQQVAAVWRRCAGRPAIRSGDR